TKAFASPWKELLVLWVGIWGGALYLLYLRLVPKRTQGMPCELVVLWAMLFAYANVATLEAAGASRSRAGSGGALAVSTSEGSKGAKRDKVAWTKAFEGGGTIVSSPLIDGDRVYVAASHAAGFNNFGVMYCLDLATGNIVWQFDADGELKQIFSSPCL